MSKELLKIRLTNRILQGSIYCSFNTMDGLTTFYRLDLLPVTFVDFDEDIELRSSSGRRSMIHISVDQYESPELRDWISYVKMKFNGAVTFFVSLEERTRNSDWIHIERLYGK